MHFEDGLTALACAYFGAIAAMATWEGLRPRRALTRSLRRRWSSAFALAFIDTFAVRATLPFLSVGAALFAAERGIGLLNLAAVPAFAAWLLALVALDASRYGVHAALHHVPWLWRIHRVHHTDRDYDFTTGLRFHPIESLFTTSVSVCVVLVLGAPLGAVLAYETCFAAVAMFAHGNVGLPARVDGWLRCVVVTPDLHRVHHSALERECKSNFGGVTPWWDRVFGTYRAAPAFGHRGMRLGLEEFGDPRHDALVPMLMNPWLRGDDASPAEDERAEIMIAEIQNGG